MSGIKIARQLLVTDTAVTGMVGTRIFTTVAEQGAQLPLIVLHATTTNDELTLAGPMQYYLSRIQVDCIGESASDAFDLGDAVIDRLNGGIVKMAMTIQGKRFRDIDCYLAGGMDVDEDETDDTSGSFRRLLSFYIRWRRRPSG